VTPAPEAPDNLRGLAWILGSVLAASAMSLAVRELSATLDTRMIVLLRAAITTALLLAAALASGAVRARLRITRPWLHLLRGALIGVSTHFGFHALAHLPLATAAVLFFTVHRSLTRLPVRLADNNRYGEWVPFAATVGIFLLAFHGLAYSLFPYLVLDRLTIWDAASAPESLMIMFVGTVIVLPVIIGYSVFAYRVFGGKATALEYE